MWHGYHTTAHVYPATAESPACGILVAPLDAVSVPASYNLVRAEISVLKNPPADCWLEYSCCIRSHAQVHPGRKTLLTASAMDPSVAQGCFRYYVSIDFGTHGSGFAYSAKVDGDCSPRTYE
jgi:hypothetical protein